MTTGAVRLRGLFLEPAISHCLRKTADGNWLPGVLQLNTENH
jgi:hypothetical protein